MKNIQMKNIFFALVIVLSFSACRKAQSGETAEDFNSLKQTVLNDFVDNLAAPQYQNLSKTATALNTDIVRARLSRITWRG